MSCIINFIHFIFIWILHGWFMPSFKKNLEWQPLGDRPTIYNIYTLYEFCIKFNESIMKSFPLHINFDYEHRPHHQPQGGHSTAGGQQGGGVRVWGGGERHQNSHNYHYPFFKNFICLIRLMMVSITGNLNISLTPITVVLIFPWVTFLSVTDSSSGRCRTPGDTTTP